ncbi:MAG: hypothetical protein Q7K57_47770 [Burkholderiaceae bacterium]|nr:hypothetical protein [Burkholderiaceae bacterium]
MLNIERSLQTLNSSQDTVAALQDKSMQAQYSIYDAMRSLNSKPTTSLIYQRERRNIDMALLYLSKAKWYAGKFNGSFLYFSEFTANIEDAKKSNCFFTICKEIADESLLILETNDVEAINIRANEYGKLLKHATYGTEIQFVDDVPIVPSICPIVILEGSSYEMGRQYIQQVVEIFGGWIFKAVAAREYTDEEILIIKKWHEYIVELTPEICEMAKGFVDETRDLGINISYWNVIQLWTGHFEPIWMGVKGHGIRDLTQTNIHSGHAGSGAAYLGGQNLNGISVDENADLCSGCCAWGEATKDKKLIAGSTTDHDCTFQVTIVAYPNEGNAFIYTPFSVNGFIPNLGQYFFAGHPGMNSKGVAYIHHGGGRHGIENESDRGYGLRRGASTFHNLRYATCAKDAQDFELNCPIGDVGTILGSVGGFYADANSAYVCEARPSSAIGSQAIIRNHSFDGSGKIFDFLYANNNSIHPRSSAGFQPPESGYQFNHIEGWFEDTPIKHAGINPNRLGSILSTKSSQGRNKYHYDSLKSLYGDLDLEKMQEVYKKSAPERFRSDGQVMSHKEREIAWLSGNDWPSSVCHRVNAFTCIMKPDSNNKGVYTGCIGPANRRALMHIPGHGYYYYDEVNEFWEISLTASAESMVDNALEIAEKNMALAEKKLRSMKINIDGNSYSSEVYFHDLFNKAQNALISGRELLSNKFGDGIRSNQLRLLSKTLRYFTQCQTRAKQLITELSYA